MSIKSSEYSDIEKKVHFIRKHFSWISSISPFWKKGYRHNLALYLSGYLRKSGLLFDQCRDIIKLISYLSKDEEDRIRDVEDTYRKNIGEIAGYKKVCKILNTVAGFEEAKNILNKLTNVCGEERTVAEKEELNPLFVHIEGGASGGIDYEALISDIRKKTIFKTLTDTEQILYYDNGIYRYNGEGIIKEGVESRIGEKGTEHVKKEVIGHIRDRTRVNRKEFNVHKHLIPLKNGLFNLETWDLQPHDPDKLFTYQLPVEYNPDAKCPKIYKFFSEVLNEDNIPLMQEIFGYCLWVDYPSHKTFWLLGLGRNGKGVTLNLLSSMLGKENVTNIPLRKLEYGRFALYNLYGKLANIMSEPDPRKMEKSTVLKMLTGGDLISAEKKNVQNEINFTNYAKMIIAANQIPEIVDTTIAFWERVITIKYPNFFGDDKADKNLIEKLTTPEELSGLLNWSLDGLKRLRENNWNFTKTQSAEEMKVEMKKYADPVFAFIEEKCIVDLNVFIPKDDLYNAYREYCGEKDLTVVVNSIFAKELKRHAKVKTTQPRIGGKRIRVWQGITLRSQDGTGGTSGTGFSYSLGTIESYDK